MYSLIILAIIMIVITTTLDLVLIFSFALVVREHMVFLVQLNDSMVWLVSLELEKNARRFF